MPMKLTIQHFRKGALINTTEEEMNPRQLWMPLDEHYVIPSAGNNDRFIDTLTWLDEKGEEQKDLFFTHLYHLPDKVLIYRTNGGSYSQFIEYTDRRLYIGEMKQVDEGIIIGPAIDDFATRVWVECKEDGLIKEFHITDRQTLKLEPYQKETRNA